MTPTEIIKVHASKNVIGGNANGLINAVKQSVSDGFKIVRFNDVLFVNKDDGENCLFSIINGGGPKQYIQAVRSFISYIKKQGIKRIFMYVSDKESSAKIAQTVGLKDIQFDDAPNNTQDNILLIART